MSDKLNKPSLVRAPLITDPDGATHGRYETCSYAFFPSCNLTEYEPEITAKVFDALLFQNPDTAIFIHCCGMSDKVRGDTESFNETVKDIKENWEDLGRPVIITACPACKKMLAENLPEIETASLYEMLLDYGISGGCNSEDYGVCHSPQASEETRKAVESLASDMGVKLYHEENATASDGSFLPAITYSIKLRNTLKQQGRDSAHILELMFGMGASNSHLIHEHNHDREHVPEGEKTDCDGNCSACAGCEEKPCPPAPLPDADGCLANREELIQVLKALYWNEL